MASPDPQHSRSTVAVGLVPEVQSQQCDEKSASGSASQFGETRNMFLNPSAPARLYVGANVHPLKWFMLISTACGHTDARLCEAFSWATFVGFHHTGDTLPMLIKAVDEL